MPVSTDCYTAYWHYLPRPAVEQARGGGAAKGEGAALAPEERAAAAPQEGPAKQADHEAQAEEERDCYRYRPRRILPGIDTLIIFIVYLFVSLFYFLLLN